MTASRRAVRCHHPRTALAAVARAALEKAGFGALTVIGHRLDPGKRAVAQLSLGRFSRGEILRRLGGSTAD